jgi:hypothetical protein
VLLCCAAPKAQKDSGGSGRTTRDTVSILADDLLHAFDFLYMRDVSVLFSTQSRETQLRQRNTVNKLAGDLLHAFDFLPSFILLPCPPLECAATTIFANCSEYGATASIGDFACVMSSIVLDKIEHGCSQISSDSLSERMSYSEQNIFY